jgi:hypothetical protein
VRQLWARRRAHLPRHTNAATRVATSSRAGLRGCGWPPRPQRDALQPLREVRSWLAPARADYQLLALGNQTGRHKPGHGGSGSGLSGEWWRFPKSPYVSGARGTPRAPARRALRPQILEKVRPARRPKNGTFRSCARKRRRLPGKAGHPHIHKGCPERMHPGARAGAAPVAQKCQRSVCPCGFVRTFDPCGARRLCCERARNNKTARTTKQL